MSQSTVILLIITLVVSAVLQLFTLLIVLVHLDETHTINMEKFKDGMKKEIFDNEGSHIE